MSPLHFGAPAPRFSGSFYVVLGSVCAPFLRSHFALSFNIQREDAEGCCLRFSAAGAARPDVGGAQGTRWRQWRSTCLPNTAEL